MASEGAGAVGPPLGEMDLDEFRRAGHRIVDWIADYRAHPECTPFCRAADRARFAPNFQGQRRRRLNRSNAY